MYNTTSLTSAQDIFLIVNNLIIFSVYDRFTITYSVCCDSTEVFSAANSGLSIFSSINLVVNPVICMYRHKQKFCPPLPSDSSQYKKNISRWILGFQRQKFVPEMYQQLVLS